MVLFNNVAYQIRNYTGEFSTGGRNPSFRKKGKVWRSKSALNLHLSQFDVMGRYSYYDVVVETIRDINNILVYEHKLMDWVKELNIRKEDERDKYKEGVRKKLLGYTIYDVGICKSPSGRVNEYNISRLYVTNTKGECKEIPVSIDPRMILEIIPLKVDKNV